MTKQIKAALGVLFLLLAGCSEESKDVEDVVDVVAEVVETASFDISDWTDETHSKSADLGYSVVFDDSAVKRLDIVVTAENWQNMLDNMTDLYGTFASGAVDGGGPPSRPMPRNTVVDLDEDPIFVPAELFFEGKQWYKVGVRFKGNSSLQSSWQAGILKLSLKLDFDEYEDEYPEIKNQRFYGFKKLSLKNNYNDNSCMREKVASEVFQRAGVAVSKTAFYTLFVDHGDGAEYFGLYTLVEEVDNSLIDTQFSSDNGNLYKPDGTAASFADGTFDASEFEKKTNEDDSDWSDIQGLFAALHHESRLTDPARWRTSLDTIFDTDSYLNYLAVNTVMQNWDTYGLMTHNYYLYNNPENNKLTWIPWDNNEAMQSGKMGGALTLNFSNLETESWPLIAYLYADAEYQKVYDAYVQKTIHEAFNAEELQVIYTRYATLIEPYVESEVQGYSFLNSASDFSQAVSELKQHVVSRAAAVSTYLK